MLYLRALDSHVFNFPRPPKGSPDKGSPVGPHKLPVYPDQKYVKLFKTVTTDEPVSSVTFSPGTDSCSPGLAEMATQCICWTPLPGSQYVNCARQTLPPLLHSAQMAHGSRRPISSVCKYGDIATGVVAHTLTLHERFVNTVAFSPNGDLVALSGDDYIVWLYDAATGAMAGGITGETGEIKAIAFSPKDGATLASVGGDDMVRLWDVANRKAILSFAGDTGSVSGVAFSTDGTRLASAGSDHTVRLWEVGTGVMVRKISAHTAGVLDVTFSRDDMLLASSGSDGTVRLWTASTGAPVRVLQGHTGAVNKVAFLSTRKPARLRRSRSHCSDMALTSGQKLHLVHCVNERDSLHILQLENN